MNSIPLDLRDRLIDELNDTEKQTEQIFLVLAESLPALVGEMSASLERSRSTLECMENPGPGCEDDLHIQEILSETRNEMSVGADRFEQMSESDSHLFERLQAGVEQLQRIADSIGKIKMDSEDMELVSLNAMTVALKAGNAGRAFSYITEELKRLANRTIDLSDTLSDRGRRIMSEFQELESALGDARDFQHTLIETFRSRVLSSFEEFQGAVEATVSGLFELQRESEQLRGPVDGMMEATQLQDLIRQSIEHIVVSLRAVRPEDELDTEHDLLDELAFIRRIPELATSLIEDVAAQIDAGVATFRKLITEAEDKRRRLEERLRNFTHQDNSEHSLEQKFHSAGEALQALLDDLDRNVEKKRLLVERSQSITTEVRELEDQFKSFTTLVNRFHSIDIASRIEVAKQEVLRTMGSTSNEMNALTKQIERDVDESLATTQDFIASAGTVISEHQKTFQQQRAFVEEYSESLRGRYRRLEESRERVLKDVSEFSLFTDGFYRVFERSKQDGSRLSSLSENLRGLSGDLQAIQQAIEDRYQAELRSRNLDGWTIGNDRLQEIIERFTIFTHKRRAGELAGLNIEQGASAGEVTLF